MGQKSKSVTRFQDNNAERYPVKPVKMSQNRNAVNYLARHANRSPSKNASNRNDRSAKMYQDKNAVSSQNKNVNQLTTVKFANNLNMDDEKTEDAIISTPFLRYIHATIIIFCLELNIY